jgi:hypothetical protein
MPSLRTVSLLVLATAVALAGCGTPVLEEPAAAEGLDALPAQGIEQEDPLPPGPGGDEERPEPPRPRPFRGLGAWVDIYDGKLWRDPEGTAARLARRGVRTLFLQTTNFRNPGPIRYPRKAGRFLEAAHAHGINVVGWYLPDLKRLRRDLDWSLAAVRFESPRGHRFDGFAMDIEATEVADPVVRAARAVLLSERLRREVGPDYPLGGITPSPLRGPLYWPVLPVQRFAEIYDVLLPMAYWDGHARGARGAHAYISRSIDLLRAEGGPDMAIHVIGGVAEDATPEEMRGFRQAVRGRGLVGASIYDVDSMRPAHWREIQPLAGSFRRG